jgi:hypothetical protein
MGAKVISSEEFARELVETVESQAGRGGIPDKLSEQEVEEWLKLFLSKDDK